VLTLETDQTWQNELAKIEKDYPYRVPVPLDNLYGMHLYSKLKLVDSEVKFILSNEIPSIHTTVILPSGQAVQLYCLHPKPPSPTEAKDSTLRDAELLIVGDQIKDLDESCIVMGDLNDVAWSRTTRLFQRISGLLDPRVGRRYINTFHADYKFLRWSLDHLFHSTDFALVHMERLPHIGSDHFPIYVVLQSSRIFEQSQEELEQTDSDEKEAQEAIQEGIEKAEKEEKIVTDELAQDYKMDMSLSNNKS
jgi:endonuclease/exonuclease/phosphatase (EEP) superfamily protein YafD